MPAPEHKQTPPDAQRPSPARTDTPEQAGGEAQPPKAGSHDAMNEERRTQPSRNRGVTDI